MSAEVGQLNHEDGTSDIAIAVKEKDGDGYKVVSFPEGGGSFAVDHNVPRGTGGGEFSS